MHQKQFISAGKPLIAGSKVLIMLHGRGGSAQDILSLASHLNVDDFALIAPQATNHTWYPFSFLAPVSQNEPWLSSALELLKDLVADLNAKEIADHQIYFAGFSQGACLTLEFAARYARRWGGVAAFTGGLIGDTLDFKKYNGDFSGTPVFIGTSDPDPHVPVSRVRESEKILKDLKASVTVNVYSQMGHTIVEDETNAANRLIFL